MNDKDLMIDVIQRLSRIEANTEGLSDVRKTANEAYTKSLTNEKSIEDMRSSNRWSWGLIIMISLGFIGDFILKFTGVR